MSKDERFKVKAIRLGFFNFEKKNEGAEFLVTEKQFSKSWMERIEGKKQAAPKAKAKGKAKGPSKDDDVI